MKVKTPGEVGDSVPHFALSTSYFLSFTILHEYYSFKYNHNINSEAWYIKG